MATTKRRTIQYQYEPPIKPRQWVGDEERYAVKMDQILDDLYNKYGQLKASIGAINSLFGVGAVVVTANDKSPSSAIGGEWEQVDGYPTTQDVFAWKRVK